MTSHFLTPSAGWWIGLNDLVNDTDFVWSNGGSLAYSNWGAGNPNHFSGEDCGLMYDNNGGVYSWHDTDCTYLTSFVCR